jgi:WD40-like Beta Propeller Repeat
MVPATLADPVPFDRWIAIATDFRMQPSWSPDGQGIYYFSNRDGAFCVYLQPLAPATKRPIGEPRGALSGRPRLEPSPFFSVVSGRKSGVHDEDFWDCSAFERHYKLR